MEGVRVGKDAAGVGGAPRLDAGEAPACVPSCAANCLVRAGCRPRVQEHPRVQEQATSKPHRPAQPPHLRLPDVLFVVVVLGDDGHLK